MDYESKLPIGFSIFPSAYETKTKKETTVTAKVDKHLDAKTLGLGIAAAAALKKSKKDKKSSKSSGSSSTSSSDSSSSSSSDSSSSSSSASSAEETGSEVSKTTISAAAIPIRAHPDIPYHKTHHHSDNFHSNHVHLDSFPEVEVTKEADLQSVKSHKKDFAFGAAFKATPEYSQPEVFVCKKVYPESVVSEESAPSICEKKPRSSKKKEPATTTAFVNVKTTKTKKMGRSRTSDHHHHHLEHLGARIDDVLHPTNRYQRSLKAYSVSGGELYTSTKTSKPKESSSCQASASTATATAASSNFTIPCHHIRIGDLVILQQRPCQVIRITTSAQTGQHRYLGVDLFTKQLHEEPCVVTHPSPSVVLHSMLTPGFKQYRLIDIGETDSLVCMTETGEIKQGLKIVDQGQLFDKVKTAYGCGTGSVRVLVINDGGKELAVDYKIVHLGQKL